MFLFVKLIKKHIDSQVSITLFLVKRWGGGGGGGGAFLIAGTFIRIYIVPQCLP